MRANITITAGLLMTLATACGLEGTNYGKHGYGASTLAITNAEGEQEVLRTGTALNLATPTDVVLEPDAVYQVKLTNVRTGTVLAQVEVLTDLTGKLEHTQVAHDLGEFDDVKDDDSVQLVLTNSALETIVDRVLPVTPHIPDFQGHGFQVNEVQPAHIYSCDKDGNAVNGFVVGALPDPGEIAAPLHIRGRGFAPGVTTVDVYVVRDRDTWQGTAIPQSGETDHMVGPVAASVSDGVLLPTRIDGWQPTGKDLGPYDVLVDVDRNGQYDYAFSTKDASDGEDKVGLTIQYGAAWLRAKSAADAAQDSAGAAANAYTAADTAATTAEAAAKGSTALALAAQARSEANAAKSQSRTASTASTAASTAFNQTLADDVTAMAQSNVADAAAKKAADHAAQAAKLVSDTQQATKAYEAQMRALAAQNASKHLLVNLAYDSASRTSGTWQNTYSQSSGAIYTYVNPPVQSGSRHAWVSKWLVPHQSWKLFWNNWELIKSGGPGVGRLYIQDKAIQTLSGTIQQSCTNSPPIKIINPGVLPVETVNVLKYDIVFDYDNDGYYDVGRDFLDVVSTRTDGLLVSASELQNLPDDQIYGLMVTK